MSKKNLTLKIDEAILKRAKQSAVDADLSLSEWTAELIAKAVVDQSLIDRSRKKALQLLDRPLKLGGETIKREDLYDR